MKTGKLNIICLVMVLLNIAWIIFIFSNSIQNKEQSAQTSGGVVDVIKPIVDPENEIYDEYFHSLVRKVAHGVEFMILGMLTSGVWLCIYLKKRGMYLHMPFFITLLTAVSDEFIQSFSGRDSSIIDAMIDMGGAVTGIFLFSAVAVIIIKINKKRNLCE